MSPIIAIQNVRLKNGFNTIFSFHWNKIHVLIHILIRIFTLTFCYIQYDWKNTQFFSLLLKLDSFDKSSTKSQVLNCIDCSATPPSTLNDRYRPSYSNTWEETRDYNLFDFMKGFPARIDWYFWPNWYRNIQMGQTLFFHNGFVIWYYSM